MNTILFQKLFVDALLDVLFFPVWWYADGLKRLSIYLLRAFQHADVRLAPGLWLKNIFVPMFGQYDWQGRLMSIFMRIVNVFFRGFALLMYALVLIFIILFWITIPIIIGTLFTLSLFA